MLIDLPNKVTVVEVGPRDGLQNENKILPAETKIQFIKQLAQTGLTQIEICSFVSPKWIPQMADAYEVASSLINIERGEIEFSALVPNLIGYESAQKAGINKIAVFLSATETHNQKNINKTTKGALGAIKDVVEQAKENKKIVRAYLSVVFACPYEGVVSPEKIPPIIEKLFSFGVDEISLGDTIGAANPKQVAKLLHLLEKDFNLVKFALHFHDTRGMALVNVQEGLNCGITTFDASLGGMGGCPYAPGASGNLATEDLVYFLHSMDINTGVNLDKLIDCARFMEDALGRQLPGRYLRSRLGARQNV